MLQAILGITQKCASSSSMTMSKTFFQANLQSVLREDNRKGGAENRHCLLHNINKARRLAERPHCVDFRVFDGKVAPPEEQVEAAAAE